MSSHNDSFVASGTSPTEIGPDFRCENHGSLFLLFPLTESAQSWDRRKYPVRCPMVWQWCSCRASLYLGHSPRHPERRSGGDAMSTRDIIARPTGPGGYSVRWIANVIRELRRSRMLSASELARRSGISRGHLHHVENRSFTPSLRTLAKISAGLGVGLGRLLTLNSSEILLEDLFVQQVQPFLRHLNSQQRKLVLRTLEAAPKNRRFL
jgi:transcriptional regulator with XRE-family HTH domain